jgi:hypothetical protein
MLNKCAGLLGSVGVAVLLFQPSTAWAQAGPNLVIAMSHTGNFTVRENGVYTIVVSNVGGTAFSGGLGVFETLNDPDIALLFGVVSETGAGWSCSQAYGFPNPRIKLACSTSSDIAPGESAAPITLTVLPGGSSGTVTNGVNVTWQISGSSTTTALPTPPSWLLSFPHFRCGRCSH